MNHCWPHEIPDEVLAAEADAADAAREARFLRMVGREFKASAPMLSDPKITLFTDEDLA